MIVRQIAQNREAPEKIYSNVTIIGFAGIFLWVPLLITVAWMGNYQHDVFVSTVILSVGLPFSLMCMINEALFMGIEKFEAIPAINIAEAIYLMTGSLAVIVSGMGIIALSTVLVSGRMVSAAAGLWLIFRKTNISWRNIEIGLIWKIIKMLPPFFLNYALGILYYRVDILQLSFLVPDRELGFYSTAYKLYMIAMILPDSFASAIYPRISKTAIDGNAYETSFRAIRYAVIGLTPIVLIVYVFGETLVVMFFGDGFREATSALLILIWVLLPYIANAILSNVFLAHNYQWITAVLTAFATFLVVGLNFIFIRHIGFQGAALSLMIAQIFCSIILLLCMNRMMYKVKLISGYFYLFLPAVAGGLVTSISPWEGNWARLLVALTVAWLLCSSLKIVGREDMKWLRDRIFPPI